jgi:hypothetical protein
MPEPATGVEHALHRESEVAGVGADEAPETDPIRTGSDPRTRIEVVALVEAGVE